MSDQNENRNGDKTPIITDELKKEAADSVNQVKDIIKNVDIKKEAENTKGFILAAWKNPVAELTGAVDSHEGYFKMSVIFLCIWTIAAFLRETIYSARYISNFFKNFLNNLVDIVTATVTPLATVLVLSLAVYFLYRAKTKSLVQVIVAVTLASCPRIIASVLSILPALISQSSNIISPVNGFLGILSTVLVYISLRSIFKEDDESFIKKFIIIQAVYYLVKFILNFLNIYI